MKIKVRNSSTKGRRMTGFRTRMKTRGGRAIINRQRTRAMGKKKVKN